MTLIAVEGCTFDIQPVVPGQGVWNGAPPTVVALPSLKVKAEGKGVYKSPLALLTAAASVTNPTALATIPDPLPYPVNITTTATKSKADGVLVMLEGDFIDQIFNPTTALGVPVPTTMRISIKTAGQTTSTTN